VHDFDGTVQEALAGMEALYPGYSANLTAKKSTALEEHAALELRQNYEIEVPPLCIQLQVKTGIWAKRMPFMMELST
jgi:hypothetical protein